MSACEGEHRTIDAVLARAGHADLAADVVAMGRVEAMLFGTQRRPNRIGRFEVIDVLGTGGLGIVYLAHDPELDRKVALKLISPQLCVAPAARTRLLREAQALARLNHPNIVAVYDVGVVDDDARTNAGSVFVAMQWLDGEDMATWLKKGRTPSEILRVFAEAGRGLEAAHAQGIVHRDFKPSNVVIERDGSVKVIDFGIAALDAEDSSGKGVRSVSSTSCLTGSLTLTGSVVGTPAYMAPEQHAGARVDPRTDQFSFCVALYEALFGQRPFEGDTVAALRANVLRGNRREPPKMSKVPRRVTLALQRGLHCKPSHRHPSMDGLLEALERKSRRWSRYSAAAVLAAAALGLMPASLPEPRQQPEVGLAALRGWTAQRRFDEGKRLRVIGRPEAAERELDEALRSATIVRDARLQAQIWTELTRVLGYELRRIDDAHHAAREADAILSRIESSEVERGILFLEHGMVYEAQGDVHGALARYREADAILRDVLQDPDPRLADAAGEIGRMQRRLGDLEAAAHSQTRSLRIRRELLGDDHPEVAMARGNLATVMIVRGDHAEAQKLLAAALPVFEQAFGPNHPFVATTLVNLGNTEKELGHENRALGHLHDGIRAYETSSAADPIFVVMALDTVASVHLAAGRLDEAESALARADAFLSGAGDMSTEGANHRRWVATLRYEQGRLSDAQIAIESALEIQREILGDGHVEVDKSLAVLLRIQQERGARTGE